MLYADHILCSHEVLVTVLGWKIHQITKVCLLTCQASWSTLLVLVAIPQWIDLMIICCRKYDNINAVVAKEVQKSWTKLLGISNNWTQSQWWNITVFLFWPTSQFPMEWAHKRGFLRCSCKENGQRVLTETGMVF